MASAPCKPCRNCNRATRNANGFCDEHQQHVRDSEREYENSPQRRADRKFYQSAKWKRFRAMILNKNPMCEPCEATGRTRLADHVHHVVDRKVDPSKAFDESNARRVCRSCHNSERKGE